MPYAPRKAGAGLELAWALKVCPTCLGDLVTQTDTEGSFLLCIQCHQRTELPAPALPAAITPLVLPPAPAARADGKVHRVA
jgi:hypothetical protein